MSCLSRVRRFGNKKGQYMSNGRQRYITSFTESSFLLTVPVSASAECFAACS